MKFSIIICTFNAVKTLSSTLDSVLVQKFNDYEVIVIDGLSVDGTQGLVKNYKGKFDGKLNWISEQDKGIYDAMNKGIDLARGDWLYFLQSDDKLYNEFTLENISRKIESDKLAVVYGNIEIGDTGRVLHGEFTENKLIEHNMCHQAIFYSKSIFKKFGKYEAKYKVFADWVLNMKWFNNADVRSEYVGLIIAKCAPGGYSEMVFDKRFYAEMENLVKKYFSQSSQEFFRKNKKREVDFIKTPLYWKIWQWKKKIKFALFQPKDFIKKYFRT